MEEFMNVTVDVKLHAQGDILARKVRVIELMNTGE